MRRQQTHAELFTDDVHVSPPPEYRDGPLPNLKAEALQQLSETEPDEIVQVSGPDSLILNI